MVLPLRTKQGNHSSPVHNQIQRRQSTRKTKSRSRGRCSNVNTNVVQKVKIYRNRSPIVVKKILEPIRVNKINTPITVKKILSPIDIKRVNRPMVISKILKPLQVKDIAAPVRVDRITQPISVSNVEHPVTVEQVEQPIVVRAIETPSVIQNVVKALDIAKIQSPVTVDRIEDPTVVSRIDQPVTVKDINSPVTVRNIQQPISVSGIQSPVFIQRIEEPVSMNPLSQNVDSVTIYGSNSSIPVQTDDLGRIIFSGQVQVSPVVYTEKSFTNLQSEDQMQSLPSQDVSIQTNLSYAVVNHSAAPVSIYLQISPNDVDYITDSSTIVSAFSTQALTPLRFLRYTKIFYQSVEAGEHATFDVYYQAQSG